jgi:hypothetical protein
VLPDVQGLVRLLRERIGHGAWVRVTEAHKDGALHVHLGVSLRTAKWAAYHLEGAWGRGFVSVREFRSGGRRGGGAVGGYLAKYVGKALETERGRHAYDVAEGFQPKVLEADVATLEDADRLVARLAGTEYRAFDMGDREGYAGPEARWYGWDP